MEQEKKPYQVGATPLLLDGERAEPGDIVELTDKEAAALGDHVSPAAKAGDDSKTTKKGGKA
ncbi:MAG: hypothetical protein ACOZBV_09455 [Pseudomonadota bacterium]